MGFYRSYVKRSGVNWDLRKKNPYEVYDLIDFDIPVGTQGDCYDRYLIRVNEMRQSVRIIDFCINNIKLGLIKSFNYKYVNPTRFQMKNSMESLISHFKYYTEGFNVPKGITYSFVEAPKGELVFF